MSPRGAKIIYGLSYALAVLAIVIIVISTYWIWEDTRRRK